MNREEAINVLENARKEYIPVADICEAFDMAIEALTAFGCTGCEHYDQQQTAMVCKDCRRYYKDRHTYIETLSTLPFTELK